MFKKDMITNLLIKILTIFLLVTSIALSSYIIFDLFIHHENITQYFLYKSLDVNYNDFIEFHSNSTSDEKKMYYEYINSLLNYPPYNLDISTKNTLLKMLKVKFIPLYNWTNLFILIAANISSILLFIVTYKFLYKKIKNNLIYYI